MIPFTFQVQKDMSVVGQHGHSGHHVTVCAEVVPPGERGPVWVLPLVVCVVTVWVMHGRPGNVIRTPVRVSRALSAICNFGWACAKTHI